ncbi:rRNA maturation RNase YbeY [Marinicellulosiphila megalodicopiae]|uniref:rRNA maturation RNase YbeY n=1 Tax=Marinicellulosiphila megalodicopiae TaxID=2724896 RepID=UPI003BB1B7D4
MNKHINLDVACDSSDIPKLEDFQNWLNQTVDFPVTVNIRIVDEHESQAVNFEYREKNKPTNILSFEFDCPEFIDPKETDYLLGDLLICASIVNQEANEQNKPLNDHWAHIFIHGLLHLQGHDHIDEDEAIIMENLERQILAKFSIPDPYRQENTI